jgi:hypothetical protein
MFTVSTRTRGRLALVSSLVAVLALFTAAGRANAGDRTLFIRSAVENGDGTVTLPLYQGTSAGRTVYFIVLDTSSDDVAARLGVNRSQKLANARGSLAVQKVTVNGTTIDFPGTVNFAPQRNVVPGPFGFPPDAADPGAVADSRYSPLIELPDGTIVNAPHVANDTGRADKVVLLDTINMRVTYRETNGFQGGRAVHYVSTDASDPHVAALENVTWAPLLQNAPRADDDSTDSSRAALAAFVNGQTGADNPERQGLNSALLDGLDPLNVLFWNPSQGRYSPLWDVHPAAWSTGAIAQGLNRRQRDFGQILNLVEDGLITGPGGARFASADFVVNCPIVSRD